MRTSRWLSSPIPRFEEDELVRAAFVADRNRVAAGEACGAEANAFAGLAEAVHDTLGPVTETVGGDEVANRFDGVGRRDQLRGGRRIDAVEARPSGWWGADGTGHPRRARGAGRTRRVLSS